MKKLAMMLLSLIMVLTLTGCESKKDEKPFTAADLEKALAEGKTVTLEEYVQASNDAMADQMGAIEAQGMELFLTAEGNNFVYNFKFIDAELEAAATKESLDIGMESTSSIYKGVLEQTKVAIPDAEAVVIKYLDSKGNEIASYEFK